MEELLHIIFLAMIQGVTEFLPISSSAHLILFPKIFGWSDQGMTFDIIIHLGTLCAVFIYFRQDLFKIIIDKYERKLGLAIILGTIPVGIAGLIFHKNISSYVRVTWIIASTTLIFGILLGIAYLIAANKCDNEHKITYKHAIVIGCAQAIAIIPGVSRSGITLTAGLFAGLTNKAAARFSFLLSIPVILLATCLEVYKMITGCCNNEVKSQIILIGFTISALTGYICISLFLKFIQRFGIMIFVIYRILLGLFIFIALFI